jgi:hypothetical protein
MKPTVGLVIIDTYEEKKFLEWVIDQFISQHEFADLYIFSDDNVGNYSNIYKIPIIKSIAEYSSFVLHALPYFVRTDFALIGQWDGFIVNSELWTDEFLNFDYIGAVWEGHASNYSVGNGGFSLRSIKLLRKLSENPFIHAFALKHAIPEDEIICKHFKSFFEHQGLQFAPTELARSFSYEGGIFHPSFGFHGPKNLALFCPEDVLIKHSDEILMRISHPAELYNFLRYLGSSIKIDALNLYLSRINNNAERLSSLNAYLRVHGDTRPE